MTGEMNQQRFKALLKETITLLCSNGLNFKSEFTIEAVIGITIDRESILLVSIQDTVTNNAESISASRSITTRKSTSGPELRRADRIANEFTRSPSRMLKPHTDTNSPGNDHSKKHVGDMAIEISPVLHLGENFEPRHLGKFSGDLNIKTEQIEDGFEQKSDERSSPPCESNEEKPRFFLDETSLSRDQEHRGVFSIGRRHLFSQMQAAEKEDEVFSGVASVSRTVLETSTINDDFNGTMHSYAVEETLGVGNKDSEITAVSGVGSILTNTIALPRVHPVRNNSHDMQPVTGRNRKKSAFSSYQCKICGKQIRTLHSLAVHEATVHLGKYRYSCPNCGKGYTVLSNLRAHIACKHNKRKEFVCGFCGREYGYKHSLKEHILLVHNGSQAYS